MAKEDYTLSFKNAFIDLDSNVIVEVGKDYNTEHDLSEVLAKLEGKSLSITFKESKDVTPYED